MPKDMILISVTLVALAASAAIDRKRTMRGLKSGYRMLVRLLPQFLLLLILVSAFLTVVPQEVLVEFLGRQSGVVAPLAAAVLGSIALIPGPIAYPLAGALHQSGVSTTAVAVLVTTLMMVGVLTFPVEKEYFGARTACLRNLLSFVGALIIGLLVGVVM